ncbi:hypothetical protein B0G71_5902 [Paraburkholderia sp. BL27I4N3]|nr:hypothetical protein B0G71_5902 [Paraburkholderia sp. BL27I4N3]RKR36872.1 hypothetical protein B0G82_4928 [Paraburkholderia sp. BL17N1]
MFIYHRVRPFGSIPLAQFTEHPDETGSENPHAPAEVAIAGIKDVEGYGDGSEPCRNDIDLHVATVVRHDGHVCRKPAQNHASAKLHSYTLVCQSIKEPVCGA